jgi:hypothetical protein
MKSITVYFDDKEFKRLSELKDEARYTWRELILMGVTAWKKLNE